jgi:Fe2+ transport system protein B
MAQAPFPRYYPDKRSKWLLIFLEWLWVNVIVGAIALIISAILFTVSTEPTKLPGDLALSLIVLAMTITATAMDTLKEYRAEHGKEIAQWLRRVFTLMLVVGIVLATVSSPSEFLRTENINQSVIARYCGILLLVVTPLGFWAYSLSLRSRDAEIDRVIRTAFEKFDDDPEYLQLYRAREQRLQTALSAASGTYNGAAL